MAEFNPQVDEPIFIRGTTYTFTQHATARGIRTVHASTGRKGTVYRIRAASGEYHALKVFSEQFRLPYLATVNSALRQFEYLDGFKVSSRVCLTPLADAALIKAHPELQYAVLMPWIGGDEWENYWTASDAYNLTAQQSLDLARNVANILVRLETVSCAHCDLAGSNIKVNSATLKAELIDIEDSYLPGIQPPDHKPAGTSGYQHPVIRAEGRWGPDADRFAGGVLLAEILSWPIDEVRAAASEAAAFFDDDDLIEPSRANARFKLLHEVLESCSPEVGRLFLTAWDAPRLEDCPPLSAWAEALAGASVPSYAVAPPVPVLKTELRKVQGTTIAYLSWDASPHASGYEIQISDSPSFRSWQTLYRGSEPRANTPPLEYPRFVRIRASGRRDSEWGQVVTVGALQIPAVGVTADVTKDTFTLAWPPVPGATHYELTTGNSTQKAVHCKATAYEVALANLDEGGNDVHIWAVRDIEDIQFRSEPCTQRLARLMPPRWDLGQITVEGDRTKLIWSRAPGNPKRLIRWRCTERDASYSTTSRVQDSATFPGLKPGTYEFAVAICDANARSPFSDVLTIPILGLTTLKCTPGDDGFFFTWDPVPGATEYLLRLTHDDEAQEFTTRATEYSVKRSELKPGHFVATIRASAMCASLNRAVYGPESSGIDIRTTPDAPTNLTVSVEGRIVALAWDAVEDVDGYVVTVKDTAHETVEREVLTGVETHLDEELPRGLYTFSVAAYFEYNGQRFAGSAVTSEEHVVDPIPVPQWEIASAEAHKVTLKWTDLGTEYTYLLRRSSYKAEIEAVQAEASFSLKPGSYTFRVVAVDHSGMRGAWSDPVSVVTSLARPTILGPERCMTSSTLTVKWTEVPFAGSYQLLDYGDLEGRTPKPRNAKYQVFASTEISRSLVKGRLPGHYTFTVRAVHDGELGPESEPYTIWVHETLHAPRIATKDNEYRAAVPVHVEWNTVKNARQYVVQVANDAAFTEIIEQSVWSTNFARLATHEVGGYFLRVRAENDNALSDWTTCVLVVTLGKPDILECTPTGSGTFVRWTAVTDAEGYELLWSGTDDTPPQTWTGKQTQADTPWQTGMVQVSTLGGEWSEAVQIPDIGLAPPEWLHFRADYDISEAITFAWQTDGAIKNPEFDLEWCTGPDFEAAQSIRTTEHHYSLAECPVGYVNARVRVRRGDLTSDWSATRTCTVRPVPPSGLTLKATGQGVTARWDAMEAELFEVAWSLNRSFDAEEGKQACVTTVAPYARLATPSGTVHVRVRAVAAEIASVWGNVQKATVEREPLPQPVLEIARFADECEQPDQPVQLQLSWSRVRGAICYRIEHKWGADLEHSESVDVEEGPVVLGLAEIGPHRFTLMATDGVLVSSSATTDYLNIPENLQKPKEMQVTATAVTIELRWTPVPLATRYVIALQHSDDENASTAKVAASTTHVRIARDKLKPGKYRVSVMALLDVHVDGATMIVDGNWADTQEFTIPERLESLQG